MNEKEANIWKIAGAYRTFVLADNIVPATIRMVFSKYLIDNYLYAETREEMMFYADAQKTISSADAFSYINSLQPIMDMIDDKLLLHGLLKDIPHQMADDIFGGYNKRKNFDSDSSSNGFMQVLSTLDFTEDKNKLINELREFIYSSMENVGRRGGENVTNRSVSSLVAKLLNVDKEDTYMDFACGYGLSTCEIVQEEIIKSYLSDINQESVQIAAIMLIIQEKNVRRTVFEVINGLDKQDVNYQVSKMFVDFPLNAKIDRDQYGTSDGNLAAINKTIDHLKEDGRAVVTCPSGLLFKETKEIIGFRKQLIEQNLVEAIISLPSLVYGAIVNVNLMILSKAFKKDIIVIDASNNNYFQFSNNARSSKTELSVEGINKIANIIKSHEEIQGISKVVSGEDLLKKNTFVPASFIDIPKKKSVISVDEINTRLNELYNELYKHK